MIARCLPSILVLALGAAGCVDENAAFYIKQMAKAGENCEPPDGTGSYIGTGTLDVSLKQGYWGFPEVMNDLTSSTASGYSPERNSLVLKGFEITIDPQGLPGSIPEEALSHTEQTSGYLAPGSSLVVKLQLIRDELAALLAQVTPQNQKVTILLSIRGVAERSGSEMKTGSFDYPIRLCSGCLVDMRSTCPEVDDESAGIITNTCGAPQDEPVTCCQVSGKPVRCFSSASAN